MERRHVTCRSGKVVNVGQILDASGFFHMLSTALDFLRFLKCDYFLCYVYLEEGRQVGLASFTERLVQERGLARHCPVLSAWHWVDTQGVRAEEPCECRT